MKVALFVDGANMYASSQHLDYDVDYAKLIRAFSNDCFVLRAYYYTALLTQPDGTNNLRKMLDYLEYNGYSIVAKESKSFEDKNTGLTKVKGNMDIEIAVDMLHIAKHVDSVVLFSGDGDFTYLVKAVQQMGVHVTVVSTMKVVADELRRAADIYCELTHPRVKVTIKRTREE